MTKPHRSPKLLAAVSAPLIAATLAVAPAATAQAAPVQASAASSVSVGAKGTSAAASSAASEIRSRFGVSEIGGHRAGSSGDHGSGRAIDVMVTGKKGDRIASWAQDNAGRLGVKYIIWEQGYWQPGMDGYRQMEDRGSATQNHYDHVHISFKR